MGNGDGPNRLTDAARREIETRLRDLTDDLARYHRILQEFKQAGEPYDAVEGIIRLLAQEQEALISELGYNPGSN